MREKVRGSEDKKFGVRRPYTSNVLCQVSLLRSTLFYILFLGEKWDEISRNCHTIELNTVYMQNK